MMDPLQRFRYHLRSKFGSVRRAFKAFDAHGRGRLSFADFEHGLEKFEVRWMETSGMRDMQTLFKELDVEGDGVITCSRLLGQMNENADEHDEWQYLTTMEKWTRWCSHTEKPSSKSENPHTWNDPLHKAREDISAMRCQLEGERDRSRARMQRMIQQGMHRTKAGLQLAATHLPKDIGADHFSVQRYRQHALEKVEQQSKRIKQQIEHTSLARHELKHCSQALRSVDEKTRREEAEEWRNEHRSVIKIPHAQPHSVTFDLVNDFSEDQLTEEERNLRYLARSIGISLPDAEAIQVQYRVHAKAGEGITHATFPDMVKSLVGDVFSDVNLHELWRTLDHDNRGHITFEEYLEWHFLNLDSPHLSGQLHVSKSPRNSSCSIGRAVSFASLHSASHA
jgi:Ca2+-binding EF-hand superfamily protein